MSVFNGKGRAFRRGMPRAIGAALMLLLLGLAATVPGAQTVKFVVLVEHAQGSPARAQPHLDRLLTALGKQAGWQQASGRYFSSRAPALKFVETEEPQFGILSLPAFLAMHEPHKLVVVGEVKAPKAGGRQYALVSVQQQSLAACRGKRLSTTLASEPRFIERVVARGAYRLGDFQLVEARRPLEPLKQVLRGSADCALVDDAQLEALQHIEGGSKLKNVWQSQTLPGMAVVAFPRAVPQSVTQLKASLGGLCKAAPEACSSVGIERIAPAGEAAYRGVLDAYVK